MYFISWDGKQFEIVEDQISIPHSDEGQSPTYVCKWVDLKWYSSGKIVSIDSLDEFIETSEIEVIDRDGFKIGIGKAHFDWNIKTKNYGIITILKDTVLEDILSHHSSLYGQFKLEFQKRLIAIAKSKAEINLTSKEEEYQEILKDIEYWINPSNRCKIQITDSWTYNSHYKKENILSKCFQKLLLTKKEERYRFVTAKLRSNFKIFIKDRPREDVHWFMAFALLDFKQRLPKLMNPKITAQIYPYKVEDREYIIKLAQQAIDIEIIEEEQKANFVAFFSGEIFENKFVLKTHKHFYKVLYHLYSNDKLHYFDGAKWANIKCSTSDDMRWKPYLKYIGDNTNIKRSFSRNDPKKNEQKFHRLMNQE